MLSNLNTFDTLLTIDSFRTLARLIDDTEIESTLRFGPALTLFAPVNQAFHNLPDKFLDKLISARNNRLLLEVLQYHLVPGKIGTAELALNEFITTEQGHDLKITTENGTCKINEANVVLPDIQTTDGVIHGIDELLIPGEIALVKYLSLSRSIAMDPK